MASGPQYWAVPATARAAINFISVATFISLTWKLSFQLWKFILNLAYLYHSKKVISKLNHRRVTRVPAEKLFNNLRFPKTIIFYLIFPKKIFAWFIFLEIRKRDISVDSEEWHAWHGQIKLEWGYWIMICLLSKLFSEWKRRITGHFIGEILMHRQNRFYKCQLSTNWTEADGTKTDW